jgi:hypothetical protein
MYRSGSTWQYNIASRLVEQHRGGCRLGFFTPANFIERRLRQRVMQTDQNYQILKVHDRDKCFASLLADGCARAVYSYRDLRDVAYSLMHKLNSSFEDVVLQRGVLEAAIANDEFWTRQPGTVCQEYDRILSTPVVCIHEVADHLGISISRTEAESLAHEYSLEANRQRAQALSATLAEQGVDLSDARNALLNDPHTLLHWNHVRSGRSGSWREHATLDQKIHLARICGRWLVLRDYEKDESWVFSPEELKGDVAELSETCERLARSLQAAQNESAELRAEVRSLQARLQSEVASARQDLARIQARFEPLAALGANSLWIAQGVHKLAHRYPRIAKCCRQALSLLQRSAA